jgi:UTP-glucose-1-phosphate uridylyltransferase
MTFDVDILDVSPVKVGAPLHFVFADLNARKDTVTILRDLNAAYPYPRTAGHASLHRLLGRENEHIIAAVMSAMASGDAERAGRLMTEAQALFDRFAAPLSPVELESPTLHSVLNDSAAQALTYGGKGVGSQGDGTVQFIARSGPDAERLKAYLSGTLKMEAYSVTVPKTEAVRRAVIPLGGLGTRMYPSTKVVKKEFMPVVDADGLAKPALLVLLENLHSSGVEEICLVIRPAEEALYRQLLDPPEYLHRLSPELLRHEGVIAEIRGKVTFVYQDEPLGFAHAVAQSERFSGGEPTMVLLGDHLFESDAEKSCLSQIIQAYERHGELTVGLFEIPFECVNNYGIAKIKDDALALDFLVEKPSRKFAKSELSHKGKYYGVFLYVITPQVYAALRQGLEEWDGEGELQFTAALDSVARKYGAYGAILDGVRYDVGLPSEYRRTVAHLGAWHLEAEINK